jgi:hypothetical protein
MSGLVPIDHDLDRVRPNHKRGDTVSQSNNPSDPNSDPLRYSASGLPAGLNINASTGAITGTITGTIALGPEGSGPHRIVPGAGNITLRASPWLWEDSNPTASAALDNDVRPDVIIDPPKDKDGNPPDTDNQ